jgi:hypothetical protein
VTEDELQEETERTMGSITNIMSESDRKQFDSPEAVMNLAGNIYAEMRTNRTLEYLRKVAQGELEAEAESEEEAEGVIDRAEPATDEVQETDLSPEDELLDSKENKEEPEEEQTKDIDLEKQDSDEEQNLEQEGSPE